MKLSSVIFLLGHGILFYVLFDYVLVLAVRPQLLCHPAVHYIWHLCLLTDDLIAMVHNLYVNVISLANLS